MAAERLVLASRSPRRVELIAQLGREIDIDPADIDESPLPAESPVEYVRRVAIEKARVVHARHPGRTVLAADTTIDLDGMILGQPTDDTDARRMLRLLSGRTHRVHTGVTVITSAGDEATEVATSLVTFVPVTDELLEWYLATDEWRGKAGGYAVQGEGAALVERVQGSVSTVVGLPLRETAHLLGVVPPAD